MDIDEKLIKNVANLARLKLSEEEEKRFLEDFKNILSAFSDISKCDTKNTKPSIQPVVLKNRTREDKPGKCLTNEEALSNTENKEDGYFKGPKAV
jgi:aspartyl-tRNA(Asn)/glutamyl-tRNA(Gln) amidotransferase subunit C